LLRPPANRQSAKANESLACSYRQMLEKYLKMFADLRTDRGRNPYPDHRPSHTVQLLLNCFRELPLRPGSEIGQGQRTQGCILFCRSGREKVHRSLTRSAYSLETIAYLRQAEGLRRLLTLLSRQRIRLLPSDAHMSPRSRFSSPCCSHFVLLAEILFDAFLKRKGCDENPHRFKGGTEFTANVTLGT